MKLVVLRCMMIVTLLCYSHALFAEVKLRSLPQDQRIKKVLFRKNDVVLLAMSPFVVTQIAFGQGEKIQSIHCGDAAAWNIVVDNTSPNHLFIKPLLQKSDSDLIVLTNQHQYYFHLIVGAANHQMVHPMYAIQFVYAHSKGLDSFHTSHGHVVSSWGSSSVNSNYSFSGDNSLKPKRVYDDGHFTYFQFRHNSLQPAIYAVRTVSGQQQVINSRVVGDDIVVLTTSPQFDLRYAKHKASVFNLTMIDQKRLLLHT